MSDIAKRLRDFLVVVGESAVVLERLAYGAGSTNWWSVPDEEALDIVWETLRSGSVVSIYSGQVFPEMHYYDDGRVRALEVLKAEGEVCLGLRGVDGVRIEMEFVGGPSDLAEFETTLGFDSRVFVAEFPTRIDDGVEAVTFTVPDPDGVTRLYPH